MSLKKCKVYNDGSHFIAIKPTTGKKGVRRPRPPEEVIVVKDEQNLDKKTKNMENMERNSKNIIKESKEIKELGELSISGLNIEDYIVDMETGELIPKGCTSTKADEFLKFYRQSVNMGWYEQVEFIVSKMRPYFKDEDSLYRYVVYKLQCRFRADMTRRLRCLRRAALHHFNYFCTFTYDSKKMDEQTFQKKLLTTLRHFAERKGWKYMGAWERGGDNDRLHFHALVYVPEGAMSGEIVVKHEYNVKTRRMEDRNANTFFDARYGRSTFDYIDGTALTLSKAVDYTLKYIEKDGGRMICSKGLRTFIETDIDEDDIITLLREDNDTKYILFDDFTVYRDGKELGEFSPGILANAKTVN